MAEGKRFDACTPRPKRDGGTWWHRVGSAWQAPDGKMTVYLDSVPLPDKESGNIKIMLFEPRDDAGSAGAARQRTAAPAARGKRDEVDDSEIPF